MSGALTLCLAAYFFAGTGAYAIEDASAAERLRGVDSTELAYTYAIGSFTPEYTPPAPGSYTLPVIKTIVDHPIVDAGGEATTLFAVKQDKIAILAFVYTTCVEAVGCPLSQAVLQQVDRALAADAEVAARTRLLTVSFDPERDTPQRMQSVRAFYEPLTDWRFVTTRDDAQLQPLLTDFGQPVAKLRFADGQWSGLFRHVLKVFLLDPDNRVRNIYSVGFLNPQLVINDVRTLLLPAPSTPRAR